MGASRPNSCGLHESLLHGGPGLGTRRTPKRCARRPGLSGDLLLARRLRQPALLPYLDTTLRPKRKMLVGSSDVTALHAALGHLWPDIDLIYGPNIATNQLLGQTPAAEANRRSMYDLLFVPPVSITETLRFIRPGTVSGPMVGGCLSLLVTLLGTKYDLPTAGKVLFIEEVGEPPYKIDRMLTHLRNACKLESVRGVVFGEMYNCRDAHNDIWDVLKDIFQHDNFPVAFGLRNGHGEINLSIRMGADVEIDSVNSTLRFI